MTKKIVTSENGFVLGGWYEYSIALKRQKKDGFRHQFWMQILDNDKPKRQSMEIELMMLPIDDSMSQYFTSFNFN